MDARALHSRKRRAGSDEEFRSIQVNLSLKPSEVAWIDAIIDAQAGDPGALSRSALVAEILVAVQRGDVRIPTDTRRILRSAIIGIERVSDMLSESQSRCADDEIFHYSVAHALGELGKIREELQEGIWKQKRRAGQE